MVTRETLVLEVHRDPLADLVVAMVNQVNLALLVLEDPMVMMDFLVYLDHVASLEFKDLEVALVYLDPLDHRALMEKREIRVT